MFKSIIGFFVGNWVSIVSAAAVAGGLYGTGYMHGSRNAGASCSNGNLTATTEAQKTHETVQNEILDLPDDALDRELSRWMRD